MAAHGMFSTTELVLLLRERGIDLSVSQVHRLATGTPERLSLAVLAALCDIFECTPAELIATKAENASGRKTATDDAVIDPAAIAPKRAPCALSDEPGLHDQGAVRAPAYPRLHPLRTPSGQGRELRRADLPHLLRPRRPHLRPMPGLRHPQAPARPPERGGRGPDLPRLRGHHPRLLLQPLRIRGLLTRRASLRTLHPRRQAHPDPR